MPRFVRILGRIVAVLVVGIVLVLGATAVWVRRASARANETYPPVGRFITIAHARLHYVDTGFATSGDAPVVLIHGNAGSVRDFDRLIPVLAATRRVIAVDRPGHGHSGRADLEEMTPGMQAALMHSLLQGAGVQRPILVGHSWGGALALAYASEHPDAVSGLVLLGTRAYPVEGPPDPLYALLRRPVIGPVLQATVVPIFGRDILEGRVEAAYRPDSVQQDHLASARALWMRPGQIGATVWDTFLLQRDAPALARQYATIGAPAVIMVGDGDDLLPESQQLSMHLPNAWIEVVSGAGHYLPRTHVADVQRAIAVVQARARALVPAPGGTSPVPSPGPPPS
jgi:pimeloyl-ACP methyl ester carboxylesterase